MNQKKASRTPLKRNEFIATYTQVNRKLEEKFFPVVRRAIHAKVKTVQTKLREGGISAATNYLNTDLMNPKMAEIITTLYVIVGRKHAQLNYIRLRHDRQQKGFGFNREWANFILTYLKRHLLDKITIEINNTTRNALLSTLTIMINEGLGVDGMIERLDDWKYEQFQAARIVRTEVNRAANTGAKAQAETDEFQQVKEWIAIHDNRTRGNPITGRKDHANHWSLDGITIDEGDVFVDSRNGDTLDFPGDPKASAASTINCRCNVAYTYKRDANGNLIPKRKTTTVIYPGQIVRPRTITI